MFRLLLICAALFVLYFGFTLTQSFDSKVFVSLYNYNIETTFFFSLISLILLIIFGFILIKFLVLIIDLPFKIHNIFNNRKINSDRHALILAFAEYIIGNISKAASMARKDLSPEALKENHECHNLILAETEKDIDKKITYLQKLSKSKEFAFYSNKKLAKLFYVKALYQTAEDYAVRAYNLNEYDLENLITLAYCYGQLSLWTKFTFTANKISKLHKTIPLSDSLKITDYYLMVAKQELDNGNNANATEYLESALSSNFVSNKLLELYLSLNNNLNEKKKIRILQNAFQTTPSLEIVKIFKKFTNLLDEEIYEVITKDLNEETDEIFILAIKAYLGL
ncbi:MAG: heme biosynthesis HemY N-terminal domain-containing protein [Rickettsia endosymbiont of Argas persicus]